MKFRQVSYEPKRGYRAQEIKSGLQSEVVYVKVGYILEPCEGSAHTGAQASCSICLSGIWGWKLTVTNPSKNFKRFLRNL